MKLENQILKLLKEENDWRNEQLTMALWQECQNEKEQLTVDLQKDFKKQLKQEQTRGVGKDWVKIDIQDIKTLINMLPDKPKVVNFIKTYIYGGE